MGVVLTGQCPSEVVAVEGISGGRCPQPRRRVIPRVAGHTSRVDPDGRDLSAGVECSLYYL